MILDSAIMQFGVCPAAAYVIGSTPVGALLARAHGVDLRRSGSGNVGATNVGRVLGKKWGCLCFFLDVLKGLAPVLAMGAILGAGGDRPPTPLEQASWLLVGCAAILGHVFSFWQAFRGGKGVATALGVVLGVFPFFTYAGAAAFAIWIIVTLWTRYVSVGSITAALAFGPLFWLFNWLMGVSPARLWPMSVFVALMVLLIVLRHRGNIRRLMNGTENKVGPKVGA